MKIEIKVPVLAESVSEAILLEWHKSAGDEVQRGENLIDIETDKVTLEVIAPESGKLVDILKGNETEVKSGEIIAHLEPISDNSVEDDKTVEITPASATSSYAALSQPKSATMSPKLSPSVSILLQEHNLQAQDVPCKNPGRLTKADVLDYLERTVSRDADMSNVVSEPVSSGNTVLATSKSESKTPAVSLKDTREERVPMSILRKRVSERLLQAQRQNAILTTYNEVNMQPVIDLRKQYQHEFEEVHGTKFGFMSVFVHASIKALKKFPIINASVEKQDIIYHHYFDIGIAISSPKGLVVPVIRDADSLSFSEIEKSISGFVEQAKTAKLRLEDMSGGTFSITNGGVFGSLLSSPIINPPQSAILGMHTIKERPIVENGEIVVRPMMYLALSYDHRIIDGREAVQFLLTIKNCIEEPARLLLQL